MAFPFFGADGTNGTVAATNGSATVTGTGTNWLTNNAVPTAGGYAIKMPDGQVYGIKTCTAEGTLTLVENYAGGDVSGGSYYIMPMAAAIGKLLNDVSMLLNSSNFSQLAGLSPNSGDFLEYLSGTWTTRTPIQTLLNLLNSASEVNIASASTCDIGAATSPKVQITGTTAITGFGSQANAVRFCRFGGAAPLTHDATSLVLLGGVSRTTVAGETSIFFSDASGNWREWGPAYYAGKIGVADGSSAAAGNIGEVLSASLASGSAVSLTTGAVVNVVSKSLSAGDWIVWGGVTITPTGSPTFSRNIICLATSSSGLPSNGDTNRNDFIFPSATPLNSSMAVPIGPFRINLSGAAIYYLNSFVDFSGGTVKAYGTISARRVR